MDRFQKVEQNRIAQGMLMSRSIIDCKCGSGSAEAVEVANYWYVRCIDCFTKSPPSRDQYSAIISWNLTNRSFSHNQIADLQSVFRIAARDQHEQGKLDRVEDINHLYGRIMKMVNCSNDTDNDGNCQRCKNSICPKLQPM